MNKHLILLALAFTSACSPILPIENPFTRAAAPEPPSHRPLRIEILDVGQGDATLILGPDGSTMLIDAGRAGEGAETVLPALSAFGVERLDWIVATHYDADHIGGLAEVLQGPDGISGTEDDQIPSEGIFDRGEATEKNTETYERYASLAANGRREAGPGMTFPLGDGAKAEVIVVNGHYRDGRVIPLNPDEENEACIGLLVTYGNFHYFTAGDLTGGGSPGGFPTTDMETIAGELVGDVDVLHVGHHGSESSSNQVFLEETRPDAAIISVGADNDYGHPAPSTLQRLESVNAAIYRTDQLGSLEIKTDGRSYEIVPAE